MADVAIVGAGPVGLILALGLAQEGVSVTLVEAEDGIIPSPRAMSYAWSVLDGLECVGLLDDMKTAGLLNHERSWRVHKTGEEIVYSHGVLADITEHPYMLTLGQDRLAEIILDHLATYPEVTIEWGTKVTGLVQHDDHVVLSAESGGEARSFEASWVVGCDGGRSQVRRLIGLTLDGITWPNRFVATNVYFDFDAHGWHSGYLIDQRFGAVVAQITNNGLWRVTFSEDVKLPAETVTERIPPFMREIMPGDQKYVLDAYSVYNMHQRSASAYRSGRVLLAGDAAHITNPTSGFGLVGGMFDAFVLSEALAAVVRGEAQDEVLDRYSQQRGEVFNSFTSPVSSESMRLIFHSDDPVRLEADLAVLRARQNDPDALRTYLCGTMGIETPSLLTGRRQSERKRDRVAQVQRRRLTTTQR